jgi:hypothetical protein
MSAGGRVWVQYSGLECPIDWEPAHGYAKCSAAEHIARDVKVYSEAVAAMEEERRKLEEENRFRALGIMPAPSGDKKGAKGQPKKAK